MPTLTIRNVPQEAHDALKALAARNGRSVESEVRLALDALVHRAAHARDAGERLRRARALLGGIATDGPSWADELIAGRRAEAMRE